MIGFRMGMLTRLSYGELDAPKVDGGVVLATQRTELKKYLSHMCGRRKEDKLLKSYGVRGRRLGLFFRLHRTHELHRYFGHPTSLPERTLDEAHMRTRACQYQCIVMGICRNILANVLLQTDL